MSSIIRPNIHWYWNRISLEICDKKLLNLRPKFFWIDGQINVQSRNQISIHYRAKLCLKDWTRYAINKKTKMPLKDWRNRLSIALTNILSIPRPYSHSNSGTKFAFKFLDQKGPQIIWPKMLSNILKMQIISK